MTLGTSHVFCQMPWSKIAESYGTLQWGPQLPPILPNTLLWPVCICMPKGWVPFYRIVFLFFLFFFSGVLRPFFFFLNASLCGFCVPY